MENDYKNNGYRGMRVWFIGEAHKFEEKYSRIYGKGDYSVEIEKQKKENFKKYILLVIIFFVILVTTVVEEIREIKIYEKGQNGEIQYLNRNLKASSEAELLLEIKKGKLTVVKPIKVSILSANEVAGRKNIGEEKVAVESGSGPEAGELRRMELYAVGMIKKLKENMDSKILLPRSDEDNIVYSWRVDNKSNSAFIILGFLVLLAVIYKNRYGVIDKLENEAKASVVKELPDFINKLVLMMNAGLVLTSAFQKIADGSGSKSYFYSELGKIGDRMRETNSPFATELKNFAIRTEVREFVRLANIICDNTNKGTALADKLLGEAELMWSIRKRQGEERGKLAETKLTLPLAVLLIVLVIITLAPAMMVM